MECNIVYYTTLNRIMTILCNIHVQIVHVYRETIQEANICLKKCSHLLDIGLIIAFMFQGKVKISVNIDIKPIKP